MQVYIVRYIVRGIIFISLSDTGGNDNDLLLFSCRLVLSKSSIAGIGTDS